MKINILVLFALLAIIPSCAEDPIGVSGNNDKDNNAPGTPTGITHEADYGSLTFHWTSPENTDYLYADIRYMEKGKELSKKVSFHNDSLRIEGFSCSDSYDFTFYSVDKNGNYSEGIPYSAAPLTPPHILVAPTVKITSNEFGGVIVYWENKSRQPVTVKVSYTGDETGRLEQSFSPDASTVENKKEVKNDLSIPSDDKEFTVVITDAKGNATEAKIFHAPIYEYMKIDRSNWEIPGYDATGRDGGIGYSSQATNEASDKYPKNGHIIAMLDNDANTFWHASWSNPNTNYPHWFIVDMHQSVLIREIELQRRQGNGGTAKGFHLYTCKDVSVDKTDPERGYQWEDQGEYDFNTSLNDAQKIKINKSPTARYIKVYFDESHKGTSNYAMFAEFAVWGQRENE